MREVTREEWRRANLLERWVENKDGKTRYFIAPAPVIRDKSRQNWWRQIFRGSEGAKD